MPFTVTDWMSFVDGSRKLSELSIPGTHDSASRYIESNRLTTQTDGIREQLDSGTRFIDLRVGYTRNTFQLYHEKTFLNLNFGQVRDACRAFLQAHPGETIILSLKKEDKAPQGDNEKDGTFQKRFQKYVDESASLWYLGKDIPTLGEVRGKIVLFRRFELDKGTSV
ncbi:MAG TPA: phosphatidylinositol-specific phospholipase C domain-containing protein, partial [Longimicrobium sp.]|nr:phosphatidylinositol-specific phospholipase C domain-containing protein [Longimicrobium sp.]